MRLLDLRMRADPSSTLGLHPHLSVVTGLSPAARAWFVRAIASLIQGRDSGLIVTVETGGARLVLDGEAPESLSAGDAPGVLRPQDLLDALLDRDREPVASEAPVTEEDLAAARRAAQAAQLSVSALEEAIASARAQQAAAAEAHSRAASAIEQARGDIDPYAWAAREAALEQARSTEVEIGASPGSCRGVEADGVRARIERLQGHQAALATALDMLDAVDVSGVVEALDVARIVTASGPIVPPEAVRLADEWVALREHLSVLEAELAVEDGGVESASDRLEQARERLRRAEAAAAPAPVRRDDVEALEAAHEEVLAAERRATSRLAGGRARRQLERALAAEREILERMGYPTWSAYIMGARLLEAGGERRRELEAARTEVEAATAAWARLSARLEADPEFSSLLTRLERVHEAAVAIVGDVDDVEGALRSLAIDPGPPPCTPVEARHRLAGALVAVGFEVDPEASLDGLLVHAESWLAELRTVATLRRQLELDHDRCIEELEREVEEHERLVALVGRAEGDEGDGFGHERLLAARQAIAVCEARQERHREALSKVAQLVAEAGAVAELERQLRLDLEAKEDLLAVTRRLAEGAEARVGHLQAVVGAQAEDALAGESLAQVAVPGGIGDEAGAPAYPSVVSQLADRLESARSVCDEPVPLILEDSFAALPAAHVDGVLRWLEAASATTQVIYVTDRPEVVAWAAGRPTERVGVVQGRGAFAPGPASAVRSTP